MLGDQLKSNIVLTGFMGVGKTAVGKQLAQLLQMEFIDTDQLIEESVMKIPDIFRLYGEDRFRREEMLAVKKAAASSNCVIATGGGVVLNPENIKALRSRGWIVLLTARPEVIAERLKGEATRPLLQQADDKIKAIRELLDAREKYYRNCDLFIDTSDLSVSQVAEEIIRQLGIPVADK